ncbi:gamma-glutamyltransferase [Natronobacterium texcoconense]|uniref:Gamma-glutamyltranspeptidase / glutathione hydrolase n=1 Tax=Natronobacterium texcoconense TaxID=1095778 RepID=A0A1H1CLY2_NATTX|nr:gamma-glutamyltransferase [Natronobacterium texcoconense]SDQ65271.1 gamma-glutamyltranspeptidase / glutathione hydrolase [Natronobacterium texcoconense]
MTRHSSSPDDRYETGRFSRRRFLAATGASAGALSLGTQTVASEPPTDLATADLDGVDCSHPSFDCGRQVTAADGMVSSEDPRASAAGARILAEGGNAIDAAVTVQYVLNVVSPQASGIGGGGFMVVYDADSDSVHCINSRERAPRDAHPEMFLDDGEPREFDEAIQRSEAIGVPGTLDGLETARERFGSRPRQRLLRPAIQLAAGGFTVDEYLSEQIAENLDRFNDAAREVFLDENGNVPQPGDTLVNEDFAETLELIARGGRDVFYEGAIARDIAATVEGLEGGPGIDERDLAEYSVTIDEPVRKEAYDFEIVGQPVPTSGPTTVAMITRMLEFLDVEEYDLRAPEKYHLIAEANRVAWADRDQYMGDPEFVDVPVEGLLDDDYLRQRASRIDLESTIADYAAGEEVPPGVPAGAPERFTPDWATGQSEPAGATAHFTTADRHGNVVSYTTTIEQLMGSGTMVPGRGFMLNNELTDFDFEPGGPNQVQPRKRPLSSMSPTITFRDGEPIFTAGSPGGFMIITSTQQAILHHLVYGLEPLDALLEPTIFSARDFDVMWEEGVPEAAREYGEARGQPWADDPDDQGNVQVMAIDETGYTGAADPTRDGLAVGVNLARGRSPDERSESKRAQSKSDKDR